MHAKLLAVFVGAPVLLAGLMVLPVEAAERAAILGCPEENLRGQPGRDGRRLRAGRGRRARMLPARERLHGWRGELAD